MKIKYYKKNGSFIREFEVNDLGNGCLYVIDRDNDIKAVNNKYISAYMSGDMRVILFKKN